MPLIMLGVQPAQYSELKSRIERHNAWYFARFHPFKPVNISATARRKLRENAAGLGWTFEEWLKLLDFYERMCLRCCRTDKVLVPDHVIPLKRGGSHDLSNIQPLCHKCNIWKGLKLDDFRLGRVYGS